MCKCTRRKSASSICNSVCAFVFHFISCFLRLLGPSPQITAPFTVTGADGAFITAVPDSGIKITAGVESNTVPAIGRQWFCWSMFDDLHFRYMLANAKTFFESKEAVEDLYNRGFVQAGPTVRHAALCSRSLPLFERCVPELPDEYPTLG